MSNFEWLLTKLKGLKGQYIEKSKIDLRAGPNIYLVTLLFLEASKNTFFKSPL
jgi:hypothetical protein